MEATKEEKRQMEEIPNLCMSLGIVKSLYCNDQRILDHMPVSLYPYELSLTTYSKLKRISYIWQKLFVKLANDAQFLAELS